MQRLAVDHPERVLSITLMSTSPAGSGGPEFAKLLVIDGLGHELPGWAWDEVVPAPIAVTGGPRRRSRLA